MSSQPLSLRAERVEDLEFLLALYSCTRSTELALTGWDEAACAAFSSAQFAAQRQHYKAQFPDAQYHIVEHDGVRIGRLYVHRSAAEMLLIDISLLPEYRNQGLGRQLLQELSLESRATGRPILLHVEMNNLLAHRWYLRLGFVEVRSEGMHVLMRRDAR